MKKVRKSNNGITLLALVITIIVLLILAGVSLNLVAGSNGILSQATRAVSISKEAQKQEEIQLKLAEIMMDYYIEGNGQSLQEYIIEKCKENDGDILNVGNGMFSTIDGDLYYTDSQGNTSIIAVDNSGNVTIEGSVSADGTIKDDKAPSISATSTTNSITFVARDVISGIVGWNYSTTNTEPSTWNEVLPNQKSFNYTIENLSNNTTYYIWAKDANGNVSQAKEVKTKDFDELSYAINWENEIATIEVNSPTSGVQYQNTAGNWVDYTVPISVESGTSVYFKVTDGYNHLEFESVKPVLTYTIKYNANGGNGTMSNSRYEYGTAKKLTSNGFTRDGYAFMGWATQENGTKVYDNQANVTNLSNQNGGIVNLYAVWSNKAVDLISPSNYGDKANYSANNVNDWQVFLNDETYIYLISSDYVPTSGMKITSDIEKVNGSNYNINADTKENLVNWLTSSSNWSQYATGFSGATAMGGPTKSQFCASYNAKYGTSHPNGIGGGALFTVTNLVAPYVITDSTKAEASWTASMYSENLNDIWAIEKNGGVSHMHCMQENYGIRPLVCLPANIKSTYVNGKWTFMK